MGKGRSVAAVIAAVSCSACAVERGIAPRAPAAEFGRESLVRAGDARGIAIVPRTGPERPEYTPPAFLPDTSQRVLPVVPEPPEQERLLSALAAIPVSTIVLAGSTLPEAQTAPIIEPYEHRAITSTELQELRQKLSLHYYEAGYVNSGVVIPDQRVTDGAIRLEAIEGTLSGIEVTGNRRLRSDYLVKRIEPAAQQPLNVRDLQQALGALQREPLISQINARLDPGVQLGESTLAVNVTERRPFQLQFVADNEVSPSVGGEQEVISLSHRSLSGRGDVLTAAMRYTDGLEGFVVSYLSPLNARGGAVSVLYEESNADVIEAPFDEIDIENQTEQFQVGFNVPLELRRPISQDALADQVDVRVTGAFGLETKHSESSLLGVPFSFSPGVVDGVSDVTVLRTGADWLRRTRDAALSFGGAFRIGVDAFDATINSSPPDGRFVTWQGQGQYARRLALLDSQIVVRAFAQLALDPLLPLEKLAVGGFGSVRGYRENTFVRDNGVVSSLEVRIPLGARFQLVPFADFGRSWDEDDALPTSQAESIASAGAGFQWSSPRGFFAELFYGYALDDEHVLAVDEDLQDDGIHFRFSYTLF